MKIACSISLNIKDKHKKQIFYDILRRHSEGEIKNRAKVCFKDEKIYIEAKDIMAFKIAVNSLIRYFSVLEDAWEIE